MSFNLENTTIVITGGGGTIGVALAKELLKRDVQTIRLLDQDDSALTIAFDKLNRDPKVRLFLGKIEDRDRLLLAFSNADYVFHLAAIKHVMISEYNPFDTVSVNVMGTENVIRAAKEKGVRKVIFASTDKAVKPTNTYGITKALGEKLMTVANFSMGEKQISFSSVRFGNILGSRGSVLPRFHEQLKQNGEIIVTKGDMTRFVMLLNDAVNLLIESLYKSNGGEIFVLKMIPIKLDDLADSVIKFNKNKYPNAKKREIGLFKGEKEYEELLDLDVEASRCIELEKMFIILPEHKEMIDRYKEEYNLCKNIPESLISSLKAVPIEKDKLYEMLISNNLL